MWPTLKLKSVIVTQAIKYAEHKKVNVSAIIMYLCMYVYPTLCNNLIS